MEREISVVSRVTKTHVPVGRLPICSYFYLPKVDRCSNSLTSIESTALGSSKIQVQPKRISSVLILKLGPLTLSDSPAIRSSKKKLTLKEKCI